MSELKAINAYRLTTNTEDSDVYIHNDEFGCGGDLVECYLKSEADEVIAEKDAEIARLKDKRLDVKDAAHVLKAFKFYLCQLTHCAYDESTAQWIIDNWDQDYKRVEEYK